MGWQLGSYRGSNPNDIACSSLVLLELQHKRVPRDLTLEEKRFSATIQVESHKALDNSTYLNTVLSCNLIPFSGRVKSFLCLHSREPLFNVTMQVEISPLIQFDNDSWNLILKHTLIAQLLHSALSISLGS